MADAAFQINCKWYTRNNSKIEGERIVALAKEIEYQGTEEREESTTDRAFASTLIHPFVFGSGDCCSLSDLIIPCLSSRHLPGDRDSLCELGADAHYPRDPMWCNFFLLSLSCFSLPRVSWHRRWCIRPLARCCRIHRGRDSDFSTFIGVWTQTVGIVWLSKISGHCLRSGQTKERSNAGMRNDIEK